MKFKAPAPPYAGPAAHVMHDANGRPWKNNTSPLQRIVMHGTVSPCEHGGARNIAHDFRTTSDYKSAHYVVDPGEIVQVVYDDEVAEHAPPNPNSIGIELCDPETGSAARWHDKDHAAMLELAAGLVAQLCLAYDVPVKRVGPKELLAGQRGICGHVDVSHAWHQTDHTDPTGFPWVHFMKLVEAEVARLRGGGKPDHGRKPAKSRDPQPARQDAKVTTRPERAAGQLEHVRGPRRRRRAGRVLNLLHRLFPKTRR